MTFLQSYSNLSYFLLSLCYNQLPVLTIDPTICYVTISTLKFTFCVGGLSETTLVTDKVIELVNNESSCKTSPSFRKSTLPWCNLPEAVGQVRGREMSRGKLAEAAAPASRRGVDTRLISRPARNTAVHTWTILITWIIGVNSSASIVVCCTLVQSRTRTRTHARPNTRACLLLVFLGTYEIWIG